MIQYGLQRLRCPTCISLGKPLADVFHIPADTVMEKRERGISSQSLTKAHWLLQICNSGTVVGRGPAEDILRLGECEASQTGQE